MMTFQTVRKSMLLLIASLFIGTMTACSQGSSLIKSVQPSEHAEPHEEIFTVVETPPSFPGGMDRFSDYIHQNLRYPADAIKNKVEGRVFVSFLVMYNGRLQDVTVLRGYGYGMNEEAVRLVQSMPSWIPGKQAGRPVNVKYNVVIPFELSSVK
ncbi:energy transducer TonB [Spirosoma endophyticum]|uniref:TonB family C-terminal domain-containing protein n=1 Tax=Spirosoma endophyticum TaxID=662367 RepID=A0A1I1IHK8_9BACT|nr:energy transducer TonB [Spirosoma endophyticum]SFC33253.1 TonB family C-terminal domain-containing protein [Spirosoma endophyticum]